MSLISEAVEQNITRQDPSALTTAQLYRELGNVEVRLNERIDSIKEAAKEIHDNYTRVPTLLDRVASEIKVLMVERIEHSIDVTNEKFAGISSQFLERDTRTDQRAGDTKLAVDAAFAAAKEATSKIETGFKEQIRGLTDLVDTKTAMLTQQIGDLKDRVIAMESRGGGRNDLLIGGATVLAVLIALGSLLFAILRAA